MNSFPAPLGGAEAHVDDLLGLLRGRGHTASVEVAEAPKGLGSVTQRIFNRSLAAELERRWTEDPPDLIHVHNFMRTLSVAPFVVASRLGIPTVWTAHDFQLFCPRTWAIRSDGSPCDRPQLLRCALGSCRGGLSGASGRLTYGLNTLRQRAVQRVLRSRVTRIVAPSEALRSRLESVLGRPVEHLPHPYPEVSGESGPTPPERRRNALLYAGRLSNEKGLPRLIDALASVEGLTLTVAGEGPMRAELEARVRETGLSERVSFTGWLGSDELRAAMCAHGALTVPSLWMENSPISIHEAQACGLPILGSSRGGIPELAEHERAGLVFEPLDRDSVVATLGRFAALDAGGWQQLSDGARKRARKGSREVFLGRLERLYTDAIGD